MLGITFRLTQLGSSGKVKGARLVAGASVAGASGIIMIMIVAEIVDSSLCMAESPCRVIQGGVDTTGLDITALAGCRAETHRVLCGDNVTAN
jgi:hypothetical protein